MTDGDPGWKKAYRRSDSLKVEKHYTARLIAEELEARGIGPIEVMPENHAFDLLVSGRECELKVARGRKRGNRPAYFQGILHDPAKRRSLSGEIVIMLCVDADDRLWPFVIPRLMVGNRRTVEISSHPSRYNGQWTPFLGAWDWLTNHKERC